MKKKLKNKKVVKEKEWCGYCNEPAKYRCGCGARWCDDCGGSLECPEEEDHYVMEI